MQTSDNIKHFLHSTLKKEFLQFSNIDFDVIRSHEKKFGDYSTNLAMLLAKHLNQNPYKIAEIFCKALAKNKIFKKIEVAGAGFINFYLADNFILKQIKAELSTRLDGLNIGRKKTIVIDYSSPNIAKPFGVGHLRSTIIGASVYNLYSYLGYKVIGDNHIGDWGTQFGKMIYAIKHWGNWEKIKQHPINELQKLYIKFHQQSEKNPKLDEYARQWFKKLEEGDGVAKDIWRQCVNWSLYEFNRIYSILNVKFDLTLGESFYSNQTDQIIGECKRKGMAKISDGALVVNLPNISIPAMLVKSDGATTYLARDLATIKYRLNKFKPKKIIYHVGNEQALHFKQLFALAELLGWNKHCEFVYANHGLIRTKEGKLSTRLGKNITLEELIKIAERNAKRIIKTKQKNNYSSKLVQAIAIGAIKYSDLSSNRKTDIIFDWKKMFALSGNSAPYLQYTFARSQSVLREYGTFDANSAISKMKIENDLQKQIFLQILDFNEIIIRAANSESPNSLTQYLYNLASNFNLFYDKFSILQSPPKLRLARLMIAYLVGLIIKKGLNILGIEALNKM